MLYRENLGTLVKMLIKHFLILNLVTDLEPLLISDNNAMFKLEKDSYLGH